LPTGTPTTTPTPTPPPTPTPKEPCPPLPPGEEPQLINRTPGDGVIAEILFNEDNKHVYINAANRTKIDWISYEDIKNTPSDVPIPFQGSMGYLGYYISISPTDKSKPEGKLRYIAANTKTTKDPVMALYYCRGGGDLQIVAHGVASNSAFVNWTYDFTRGALKGFISSARAGCVSSYPPTAWLPSDGSALLHQTTNVPYTIYSRLFGFCNGLDNENFHPIQAVFDPAMDQRPWHLNGNSMDIGDIFYGWGKVFVPFEGQGKGRMLIGTPDKAGTIPFETKGIGLRNTGLEEVYFVDESGKALSTPPGFYFSTMAFHPTEPLAFIADNYDSSIYLINLNDKNNFTLRYRGVKYVHPKRTTNNNDNTRQIAITGDGQYVMCKSQSQNSSLGAIFPFKLTRDKSGNPTLVPCSAIKPAANWYYVRTMKFAAGAKRGVYVTNNVTNTIDYFTINEDADVITTSPLKKVSVPSGNLDSIYTDRDRTMLAVRAGNAAPSEGDAVYFFKTGNWYYKIDYLKPKRYPGSSCRYCEPMLPLDGPVDVQVKVTTLNGSWVSSSAADVTLSYKITGGSKGDYESPAVPMTDEGMGEFTRTIHPPVPGNIEIICKVQPKLNAISDSASFYACVSEDSGPVVNCDVAPANVIIPLPFPYEFNTPDGKGKAPYVCKVKGTVQWGAAWEYVTKTVEVYEAHQPGIVKKQNFYGKSKEDNFEAAFRWQSGEINVYDKPLRFIVKTKAEKNTFSGAITIEGAPLDFTPSPPVCIVSLDKYLLSVYGAFWSDPLTTVFTLYEDYAQYKWAYRVPKVGEKIELVFKGKDVRIAEVEIPYLEDIELGLVFGLNLVRSMFSDFRTPVAAESSGSLSGGVTVPAVPLPIRVGGSVDVALKGTGYSEPDCDKIAIAVGTPTVDFTGGGQLGVAASVIDLIKKLKVLKIFAKAKAFKAFLSFLEKNPKWEQFLQNLLSLSGNQRVEVNMKGDIIGDDVSPVNFRIANMTGIFKNSFLIGIESNPVGWFKL